MVRMAIASTLYRRHCPSQSLRHMGHTVMAFPFDHRPTRSDHDRRSHGISNLMEVRMTVRSGHPKHCCHAFLFPLAPNERGMIADAPMSKARYGQLLATRTSKPPDDGYGTRRPFAASHTVQEQECRPNTDHMTGTKQVDR